MGNKLSFYDFVGYIIPGGFVAGMLYWLLREAHVPLSDFDFGSLEKSVIFIIISYLLGHLITALAGSWVKKKGYPFVEFKFSKDMLRARANDYDKMYLYNPTEEFTEDYKQKLITAMKTLWKIDFSNSAEYEKNLQSCFHITYDFVQGKNLNPKIDVFNGLYGLSKNMLVALRIGVYITLTITAVIIAVYNLSGNNDWFFYSLEATPLIKLAFPIVLAMVFSLLMKPVLRLQETYGLRLIKAVYHSFWAWYCTGENSSTQGLPNTLVKGDDE